MDLNITQLNEKIAKLERPRDDSLDNSVVVWCSEAFSASLTKGAAAPTNSTSVESLCRSLEEVGLTVRRCGTADETIAAARTLQELGQLRCVVVGGDEKGTPCSSTCTSSHDTDGNCLKCGLSWGNHYSWDHACSGAGMWNVRGCFIPASGES